MKPKHLNQVILSLKMNRNPFPLHFSFLDKVGSEKILENSRNDNNNKFFYITIFSCLVCFLTGAFFGYLVFKRSYKRKHPNQVVKAAEIFENKGGK